MTGDSYGSLGSQSRVSDPWVAKHSAARDGVPLNQFISTALAEKVSALHAEAVLRERARRADRHKFGEIVSRAGGTPPRDGDALREE